jgi:hypothetical protein
VASGFRIEAAPTLTLQEGIAMKANVGTIDQFIRAALGFVLIFLAGTGTIGAWGYLGVVLLATAAFRFCPLYRVLGIGTRAAGTGK